MFQSQYILQQQPNTIKNKFHQAIKQKNYETVKKLIDEKKILPNEEISIEGYQWTALHYASHFDVSNIIQLFCFTLYQHYGPSKYSEAINVPTKEGWSPAMICCIYKSINSLKLILEFGGVNFSQKDKNNRTLDQIAQHYSPTGCYLEIKKVLPSLQANGIQPINENALKMNQVSAILSGRGIEQQLGDLQLLQKTNELVIDNDSKYSELFLNGQRRPCNLCGRNTGLIKYTKCCGIPLHLVCFTEVELKVCPVCNQDNLELISEILHPDNALRH